MRSKRTHEILIFTFQGVRFKVTDTFFVGDKTAENWKQTFEILIKQAI